MKKLCIAVLVLLGISDFARAYTVGAIQTDRYFGVVIPEPTTTGLMLLGGGLLLGMKEKKRSWRSGLLSPDSIPLQEADRYALNRGVYRYTDL